MSDLKRQSTSYNGDPQTAKVPHTEMKNTTELPVCLKKLIACVIRTFYSCEHALVMNLLMRNTIMKEDDISERVKLDKKQLRQLLHTLKSEQFIKSKMQLETDSVEGKSVRITHYFIDYKLFVNVVKYKLDLIHRKLESEQRESSSRASFRCIQCKKTYTDLEIDRLFNLAVGKLICTYCRAEVMEEEQASPRSDACAMVARFNQQVRGPLDLLLKECDGIHLSASLLEPQIRPLEPLPGSKDYNTATSGVLWDEEKERRWEQNSAPTDTTIKIVLDSHNNANNFSSTKERPIWMVESTINQDQKSHSTTNNDNLTQTLAPGRVPSLHADMNGDGGSTNSTSNSNLPNGTNSSSSNEIMQLLMVHERRTEQRTVNRPDKKPTELPKLETNGQTDDDSIPDEYLVYVRGGKADYRRIKPHQIKDMSDEERQIYIDVGRKIYKKCIFE